MAKQEPCSCGEVHWQHRAEARVEDCPACGAVAWSGGASPAAGGQVAKACARCGERVLVWLGEDGATTLRRCDDCGEVEVLST